MLLETDAPPLALTFPASALKPDAEIDAPPLDLSSAVAALPEREREAPLDADASKLSTSMPATEAEAPELTSISADEAVSDAMANDAPEETSMLTEPVGLEYFSLIAAEAPDETSNSLTEGAMTVTRTLPPLMRSEVLGFVLTDSSPFLISVKIYY